MTLAELFSLPVGTWLHTPKWDNNCLSFIHYRDASYVILRPYGDTGYLDWEIYSDGADWAAEDLHEIRFSGFPPGPGEDGNYIYREFRNPPQGRATIESHVLVVDGELLCAGHIHHGQPVGTLTTGPRAIGEWAFIDKPDPADCLESMVEVDPETGERCIYVPDFSALCHRNSDD